MKLPDGPTVTSVGSLPFSDPEDAIDFLARRTPRLPAVPQLVAHPANGMVEEGLGDLLPLAASALEPTATGQRAADDLLHGLLHGTVAVPGPQNVGFDAFAEAVATGRFPEAVAVKGQVIGPITLAACLATPDGPATGDRRLIAACRERVLRLVEGTLAALEPLGVPILLMLDEPALAVATPSDSRDASENQNNLQTALTAVCTYICELGATCGIHCCGSVPISVVHAASCQVLSYDVWACMTPFLEQLDWFRESELLPMLGVAPTTGVTPAGDAMPVEPALNSLVSNLLHLRRQVLLSPCCGLGMSRVAEAEGAFALCSQIAFEHRSST